MSDKDTVFSRSSALFPHNLLDGTRVAIIGAGGIGSHTAQALVKLGVQSFVLYDDDIVEDVNTGAQLYGAGDIGKRKIDALVEHLERIAPLPLSISLKFERVDNDTDIDAEHIFSCVDSMAARKAIYENAKAKKRLLIDGRIGADLIRTYAIDTTDEKDTALYEASLYTDEEGEQLACTERNVAYVAWLVAGLLTAMYARKITGNKTPRELFYSAHMFDILTVGD